MALESKLESILASNIELVDKKDEGGMGFLLANLPKQYVFVEFTKDYGEFLYFHSRAQVPKNYNSSGEFGMCVFEILFDNCRRKINSASYVLAVNEKGTSTKPLKDAPDLSPIARGIIEKTVERYNSR